MSRTLVFRALPTEMHYEIASHLDNSDLLKLAMTRKHFFAIYGDCLYTRLIHPTFRTYAWILPKFRRHSWVPRLWYPRRVETLTALQWAALNGKAALVRELLSLGKDVNEVGHVNPFSVEIHYMTPLCLAAMNGNEDTIKLLLGAGAVIGTETPIGRGAIYQVEYVYYSECAITEAKDARVAGWIGEEVLRRARLDTGKTDGFVR
jgi:hypothetical protein